MRNKIKIIILMMIFSMLMTTTVFADIREVEDRVSVFKNIEVPKNTMVHGSTVALFGNIHIAGNVEEDAVAIFGNVKVEGEVTGDVVTVFGGIKIPRGGKIQGDTVQVFGGKIEEEEGAFIGGEKVSIGGFNVFGLSGIWMLFALIFFITLGKLMIEYILSVIAVFIFPEKFDYIANTVSVDMSRKFLIGILAIIGFYVISAILFMVVIGIPVVLLLVPIMWLLGFTGNTAVKLAIGKKVSITLGKKCSQMVELFIGTFIYALIELTIIGKSATFIGKAIGIGGVIDNKIGRSKISEQNIGFISLEKDRDKNSKGEE